MGEPLELKLGFLQCDADECCGSADLAKITGSTQLVVDIFTCDPSTNPVTKTPTPDGNGVVVKAWLTALGRQTPSNEKTLTYHGETAGRYVTKWNVSTLPPGRYSVHVSAVVYSDPPTNSVVENAKAELTTEVEI